MPITVLRTSSDTPIKEIQRYLIGVCVDISLETRNKDYCMPKKITFGTFFHDFPDCMNPVKQL